MFDDYANSKLGRLEYELCVMNRRHELHFLQLFAGLLLAAAEQIFYVFKTPNKTIKREFKKIGKLLDDTHLKLVWAHKKWVVLCKKYTLILPCFFHSRHSVRIACVNFYMKLFLKVQHQRK